MSFPSVVKGQYYSVAVFYPAGAAVPTAICGLTSKGITHQLNTSSEFIRDCTDPDSIPSRVVNPTGEQFDMTGTGLYDRKQGSLLRAIFGKSLRYRFIEGEPSNDVVYSGHYEGNFVLTNHQNTAPEGANVTAQFTWESDGPVNWTDGDVITDLDPLFVDSQTATHGMTYTGNITGRTAGSTITATSDDGTALTVTGSAVSGTFAAAGVKHVTLTETLAGATNTPRTTVFNVTVN